jgi:hypothetical protein
LVGVVTLFPAGIASAALLGAHTIVTGEQVVDLVALVAGYRATFALQAGRDAERSLSAGRQSLYDLEGSF